MNLSSRHNKNIPLYRFVLLFLVSSPILGASRLASRSNPTSEYLPNNSGTSDGESEYSLSLNEISIRDPNIYYENQTYYMTGTTAGDGFLGYSSTNMINWKTEGYIYQKNASNYWAQRLFWAPEIRKIEEKYYLFFTGFNDSYHRGTGVAVADNPLGPYVDLMPDPLTPPEFDCLDGHFFEDSNGKYYLIYVYEWLNEGDGAMWAQELSHDLTELVGEPHILFEGPDAPWGNTVVDGPWIQHSNDQYYLFWSSFNSNNDGKYCVGYCVAESILGPYTINPDPIIWDDGGHCSIFEDENTTLKITYHQPNAGPEHAQIRDLVWNTDAMTWEIYPSDPAMRNDNLRNLIILLFGIGAVVLGGFVFKKSKKSVN